MRDFDPTVGDWSNYLKNSKPGGLLFDPMSIFSVAAPIVGGLIGSKSAGRAADTQAASADRATQANNEATQAALNENRRQYDQNRLDQQPFMQRGNAAGNRLQELLGLGGDARAAGYGSLGQSFNGANLSQEPGYQFGMQQGQQALDRTAAAHGGYYSGAQLKAASRFGNDYGSTKYTDAYNRFNNDQSNQYNRLAGISGAGQQAVNQIGQQGSSLAGMNGGLITNNAMQNGQNTMGAANARASSYLAGGNALQNALNQGASAFNNSPWGSGRNSNGNGFSGYDSNSSTWNTNALNEGPQRY